MRVHDVKKIVLPLLVAVSALVAGGCFISKPVDPAYEALASQKHKLPETGELGSGDIISIRVFDEKELSGEFTISDKGQINYPYIGRIDVAGLTCSEVEMRVAEGLRDGYLKEPSPSCSIKEYNSKRIYVLGEVKQPGSYPYKANLSIVEAFALAGGATNRAATNGTKLTREIDGKEVNVRVPMQEIVEGRRRNIELIPGDVVYVPESAY
jgi:polysaccharide export outer membrane protein